MKLTRPLPALTFVLVCGLAFVVFAASCAERPGAPPTDQSPRVISPDISNQAVTAFAEDQFGHIWLGTLRGVNKFTSREFHQYFNTPGDSLSLTHNQISHMLCDSRGRLWVGTRNGMNRYTDRDAFEQVAVESTSLYVTGLVEDAQGRVYAAMVDELCVYDEAAGRFRVVIHDFDTDRSYNTRVFPGAEGAGENKLWTVGSHTIRRWNSASLKPGGGAPQPENAWRTQYPVHYSWMQPGGLLWLVSGERLAIFDTRRGEFTPICPSIENHPTLLRSVITLIAPYSETELLIVTTAGLFLYNFDRQTVTASTVDGFPFTAPDFPVTGIFTDSKRNLWMGSADHGFEVVYSYQDTFNANNYLTSYFADRSVTDVAQDVNGNLWVVSPELGVSVYEADSHRIRTLSTDEFFGGAETKVKNRILRIFTDGDGFVWLIAEWNRLFKCRFEGGRLALVQEHWLPMSTNTMMQDTEGTIRAGGTGSVMWTMRRGETVFTPHVINMRGYMFTNQIRQLSDGRVLVARFGCNPVFMESVSGSDGAGGSGGIGGSGGAGAGGGGGIVSDGGDVTVVDSIDILPALTHPMFVPTAVLEDGAGDVWIGAFFNGLYRWSRSEGTVTHFPGIASPEVCSIEQDGTGNIWVGTLFGLSKVDPRSGGIVNYFKSDGIGGNQFNERASCRMADGTLVFGGTHGMTFFRAPDQDPERRIPLVFENLKVGGHDISPRFEQGRIISRAMAYAPPIRLRRNENSFFISFAALDYSDFDRVRYFYMMEGLDADWLDAGSGREAYYSNLPPGRYVFRVRTTDRGGTRTEGENAIHVKIAPAPLASGWAVCCYILIFGTAAFFAGRLGLRWRRERHAAAEMEREKEQKEQINRMNMSFFANVSHEFRTPLTMISGPVDSLYADPGLSPENRRLLGIVQRSVGRMLKLVDQLMDFNKLEGDSLRLRVSRADIVSALAGITDIFRLNARNKGIELHTSGLEDAFITWLDGDKIDKIMGNLLSNALKFTPAGGRIDITLDDRPGQIVVRVADTGSGIPEDELERIFERYYQIIDSDRNTHNMGTGIGLYYARRLARLHHGDITASNNADGGATFTLVLPTGDEAYPPAERVTPNEAQDRMFPLAPAQPSSPRAQLEEGAPGAESESRYKLLVVDDDSDVGHYLTTLLSPFYKVINRFDAESALAAIEREAPDLILSDVVMPRVSGFELCHRVKSDLQLCHIPVVLVTAKTSVESQVKGLDMGADAYVSKPFDPQYLLALLKSLLKNRENVRNILTHETRADKLDETQISPPDKAFMAEIYRLMEAEMSNPELNIHHLTEALHISRSKLYYKLKGLTGANPNLFFKTYRLNRAAELLREGRFNISEIADRTGFSTLSHFSTSFKEQFGVSPSKYV